jgi:LDH2 family malate/lactate/ureidoglycolate dehydrogenase
MPPWGGREALLGTSPLAAGAPAGATVPFLLDMAPSVAARGKIRRALKRGERIPEGYALDAEGRPTTDPAKALQGVVLPVGGPKGSGLAVMMDVFAGVLSGAAYAGGVRDQYKDFSEPQNVGHFFVALKPDLFVPPDEYRTRMDILAERIHAAPRAEGFGEVLMPGEPEGRNELLRRRTGIPYADAELSDLRAEAQAAGVGFPELSREPLTV